MFICPTLCGECQFLEEHPNVPHSWGGVDDFAHAWATWQDAPGYCGCECGRPARSTKVSVRRTGPGPLGIWMWRCPGCTAGTRPYSWSNALRAALDHRMSDDCKHRRAEA